MARREASSFLNIRCHNLQDFDGASYFISPSSTSSSLLIVSINSKLCHSFRGVVTDAKFIN